MLVLLLDEQVDFVLQLVQPHLVRVEENGAVLADRQDHVVRFGGQVFDGPRLGQVDVEPFRHHRRRDHEDNEQNQHDVDERRHVDFRHESFIAADRRSHEAPLLGLSASGHGSVGVQLALD